MNARLLLAGLAALLVGCGGSTPPDEQTSTASTETTSGGESTDEATEAPTVADPVVLRSSHPVPVPAPAVPRAQLSSPLQAVWTAVEEQVAVTRPDGPEETTVQTVQEWADGPFRAWIDERRGAIDHTHDLLAEVAEAPPWERAVALALWAYAYEDFGAQIAGAPVPDEITRDDELLGIYVESLNAASIPLARRAMELYADCRERLATLGDDSEWLPWRAYCVQRGQEVIEGYRLETALSSTGE
ncbi:MAG: hypothetical protein R3B82_06145 [Sandaracinaceae bacterium]